MATIYTSDNGTKAELKKHGNGVYSLTIVSRNIGRNRWGNKSEIMQDVEYFLHTNTLPVSKNARVF